jgi:dihydrofolate reductase
MFSIIVAVSQNQVIASKGQLPWNIPDDMKYFKKVTSGKTIVMGSKTYLSIGKCLEGRRNIILTRDKDFKEKNAEIYYSVEDLYNVIDDKEEIMIIGGANIYEHFLPVVDKIYYTQIYENYEGDTFFPNEWLAGFREVEREDHLNANPSFSWLVYEREKKK